MKFLPAIILYILLGLLATGNSGFASSVSSPSTVPSKPSQPRPASPAVCVALAPPSGTIVHVSAVAQLQQAVANG